MAHDQWFVEEGLRRVDETKRPEKSKSAKKELEMIGSFKKLSFDWYLDVIRCTDFFSPNI